MRPICTIPFAGLVILAGLSFSINGSKPENSNVKVLPGFAVVELFTSEGCSSCPSADDLAIKFSKEYPENVFFLGYHVDYWNYLGWKDKFSKSDYTERQRKYAGLFNLKSIYTPQVIINGKKEFVGSDQIRLSKTIREELSISPEFEIKLAATPVDQEIKVSYKTSATGNYILRIIMVQLNAETPVKRGENNGRTLKHINVVREIHSVSLNQKPESELRFKIPEGLAIANMKCIAFVQGISDMKIVAAAEAIIK